MENRKSRRASTDSVSAFSGSPEAQDLNRDAAARNLPSALAEVAAAATKNANKAAKTGPGIDDEDLFLYSSREAEEAKEGNEAAVLSSSEEEEEADVLATPPPQTEPAEEKDPKRVAHEKLAEEVTMPADIKTARHKEIWHLALSWEFSNIRTPETNKKLSVHGELIGYCQ